MTSPARSARRIAIACGGTAGHVFPALATADAYRQRFPATEIVFLGTHAQGFEARLVREHGYALELIAGAPLFGQGVMRAPLALVTLVRGMFEARRFLRREHIDGVLGFGGYASMAPLLAARTLGLPTGIVECNAAPGLANQLLRHVAGRVFLGFDEARAHFRGAQVHTTGTPLRREIAALSSQERQPPAAGGVIRLLVLGGSQGSAFLNRKAPELAAALVARGLSVRVRHQTGDADDTATRAAYLQHDIDAEVIPFVEAMADACVHADFALAAAGAGTIAELAAAGLPSFLVPNSTAARNHQVANAEAASAKGGCGWIREDDWDPERVADQIVRTVRTPQAWQHASSTMRRQARPNAALLLVEAFDGGSAQLSSQPTSRKAAPHAAKPTLRVAVLVLGDVGRSPRMSLHVRALANSAASVDLIAYSGKPPAESIGTHPHVRLHLLPAPSPGKRGARSAGFLLHAASRFSLVALRALRALLVDVGRPDVILVQVPPALPTLPIALVAAWWHGARVVVDWHNLGFSMLSLRIADRHPVIRASRRVENWCGRRADSHLCVSQAMGSFLRRDFGLTDVHVFPDRPDAAFTALDAAARTAIRRKHALTPAGEEVATFLVATATSWSADEDFGLLLEALALLERALVQQHNGPRLGILITGDGPNRSGFERQLAGLRLTAIRVQTAWFPASSYAEVLAAADLGLCLHRSSSGLDLPMKILDMFGSGVPVAALDYGPCLAELVHDGIDGRLFRDAAGLVDILATALSNPAQVDEWRRNLAANPLPSWEDTWSAIVGPLIREGTQ